MVLLRYFLTIVPACAALLGFAEIFSYPQNVGWVILAWLCTLLFSRMLLGAHHAKSVAFWKFAVPPLMLFLSGAVVVLLLETNFLRWGVALWVMILIAVVDWNLYLFLYQPIRYTARSLEHLSVLANLSGMFFSSAAIVGMHSYLGGEKWIPVAAVSFCGLVLLEQSLWVSKCTWKESRRFLVCATAALAALTAELLWLPFLLWVTAAILCVCSYLLLGVARHVYSETYTAAIGRRYFFVSTLSLFLLLVTAQWT